MKPGRKWWGNILNQRRHELRLTTRQIAEAAKINSPNMISYIEKGQVGIAAHRVEALAHAYQIDVTDFRLCWIVARLTDDKVPEEILRVLFNRPNLWDRGMPGSGANGLSPQPPDWGRVRPPTEPSDTDRVRKAIADFLDAESAGRDGGDDPNASRRLPRTWWRRLPGLGVIWLFLNLALLPIRSIVPRKCFLRQAFIPMPNPLRMVPA